MAFYSYGYSVTQNKMTNIVFIIVTIALAAVLLFIGYRYFKNRSDNKYRDLLIIFVLGTF